MAHISISKMSKLLKQMYKEYKNDKPSDLPKKMKGGGVFPTPITSMMNISSLDMKSFTHPSISSISRAPHSNFAM
jgi:hypothetical protein